MDGKLIIQNLLTVPQMLIALLAKACFVNAPAIWNLLSNSCKHAKLLSTVISRLKTKVLRIFYQPQQYTELPQSTSDMLVTHGAIYKSVLNMSVIALGM